jgi:hypothetical protein
MPAFAALIDAREAAATGQTRDAPDDRYGAIEWRRVATTLSCTSFRLMARRIRNDRS